jgi:hypothetical protein
MIINNCEVPTGYLEREDNINSIVHFEFIPEGATVNMSYKEALCLQVAVHGDK